MRRTQPITLNLPDGQADLRVTYDFELVRSSDGVRDITDLDIDMIELKAPDGVWEEVYVPIWLQKLVVDCADEEDLITYALEMEAADGN